MPPRPPSGSHLILFVDIFPVNAPISHKGKHKLPTSICSDVIEGRHKTQSLRQLAKEYGVSHETVRRTLKQVALRVL
jgi:DNA-binding GntR family transcriptional regulator